MTRTATIKQDFRIGQKVWVMVMFDWEQFKIIGYHEPSKQWQVQWLTGPGSFFVRAEAIHKRKPKV